MELSNGSGNSVICSRTCGLWVIQSDNWDSENLNLTLTLTLTHGLESSGDFERPNGGQNVAVIQKLARAQLGWK